MQSKSWVIQFNDDTLKVVVKNQKPKGANIKAVFEDAPVDGITGELERAEWLQVESIQISPGNFEDQVTINQTLKDSILASEAQEKADNEASEKAKNDELKSVKSDVSGISMGDLQDAIGIRNAIIKIQQLLIKMEERLVNIDGEK